MKFLGLTEDEVLRVCAPESELEIKLYEIATGIVDTRSVEDREARNEYEHIENRLFDSEYRVTELEERIQDAIDALDGVEGAEKALKILEA